LAPSSSDASGTDTTAPSSSERHSLDSYDFVEIERSQIKAAEYNPRQITDAARRKLKAAISKVGMLAPVTWNRITGNLVGGHQRISALDAINRGKGYKIRVAAVEMTEAEEKAANILLNNPEAQGEWDFDQLNALLKDPDLDLTAAGMGAADVFKIIGEDSPDAVLDECERQVAEAHEQADKIQEIANEKDDRFYLVVVFKNYAARLEFTERMKLDDNRYVSAEDLQMALDDNP